jgi:hypothetical protein
MAINFQVASKERVAFDLFTFLATKDALSNPTRKEHLANFIQCLRSVGGYSLEDVLKVSQSQK